MNYINKKITLCIFLFVISISTFSFAAPKPWTKEEESKMSLFFSNFAEVFLENFSENELSDALMIEFAKGHIYRNRYKKLETLKTETELFKLIPAEMVDEISLKFFGKKPSKQEEKVYNYPEADGEAYVFSHIYAYTYNEKDDTYTVKGYILSANNDFKGDPYGDIGLWKKAGNEVDCYYCFEGKIKTSPFDKKRYILLSYKKYEPSEEETANFTKAYNGK